MFYTTITHIIAILFGSGLLEIGKRIQKRITDKKIEKEFPIAGTYLTKFEDEKEGKKISQSASAKLSQKGKKITGVTSLLNDDQIWKFEGQITSEGYFHGTYDSKNPYDNGAGNFFLRINPQKRMEGVWSGYDFINKKITSGRYTFTPVLTDVLIKNINENDLPAIVNIADTELGKDYLTKELLNDYAANNDKYVFQVARKDKEIIGFCISVVIDKEEISHFIKSLKLNKTFDFSKKIGIVKTVAVKKDYKARGIGTELVKHSLDVLEKAYGIRSFCSIGWKNNQKINIEGILKKFKFYFLEEIPEYWAKESLEKSYNCAVCGSPPCKCPAIIYIKSI